jgi:proteasome lid subunit RPN8/RPN11
LNPRPTTQLAEDTCAELWLRRSLAAKLHNWAAAGYPFEICGLLIGRLHGQEVETVRVTRGRNLVQERRRDRYLLDPDDFLAADRQAQAEGLEIVGFWHTHPDHPARPSQVDLEAAWEGYSYVIIATMATGAVELRSWRLQGGRFVQQIVHQEEQT